MTPDREHAEVHRIRNWIDWYLNDPRARFAFQSFEFVALVIAVSLLWMTYQERDDRVASRSFRAWGVALNAFEEAVEDDKNLYSTNENYRRAISHRIKEALEYLNRRGQGDFQGFSLPKAYLAEISLPGANLRRADLKGADLSGAGLSGADLTRAELDDSTLVGTDLSYADLSSATLDGAEFFASTNLENANLTGASLRAVTNLSQSQLNRACANKGNSTPLLPPKLKWSERPCPKPNQPEK